MLSSSSSSSTLYAAQSEPLAETVAAMSDISPRVTVPNKPLDLLDATSTVEEAKAMPRTISTVKINRAKPKAIAALCSHFEPPHVTRLCFLSRLTKAMMITIPYGVSAIELCEVAPEVIAALRLDVGCVVFTAKAKKEVVSAMPESVWKVGFHEATPDVIAVLKCHVVCVAFYSAVTKEMILALPQHVRHIVLHTENISPEVVATLKSHVISVTFHSHATREMIQALPLPIPYVRYVGENTEIKNLLQQQNKFFPEEVQNEEALQYAALRYPIGDTHWTSLGGGLSILDATIALLGSHVTRVSFQSSATEDGVLALPRSVWRVGFHDASPEAVAALQPPVSLVSFGSESTKEMALALPSFIWQVEVFETKPDVIAALKPHVTRVVFSGNPKKDMLLALPPHVDEVMFHYANLFSMYALKPHVTTVSLPSSCDKDAVLALPPSVKKVGLYGVRPEVITALRSHVTSVILSYNATEDMVLALPPHIHSIEYHGTNAEIKLLIAQRRLSSLEEEKEQPASTMPIVLGRHHTESSIARFGAYVSKVTFTEECLPTTEKVKALPAYIKCVEFNRAGLFLSFLNPGVNLILQDSPTVTREAILAVPSEVTSITYLGHCAEIKNLITQRNRSLGVVPRASAPEIPQRLYWLTPQTTVSDVLAMPVSVSSVVMRGASSQVIAALKSHVRTFIYPLGDYRYSAPFHTDVPFHIMHVEASGETASAVAAKNPQVRGVTFFSNVSCRSVRTLSPQVNYVEWNHATEEVVRALTPHVIRVKFRGRGVEDAALAAALPPTVLTVSFENTAPGFIQHLAASVKTVIFWSPATNEMVSAVPDSVLVIVYMGTNAEVMATVARRNQQHASSVGSLVAVGVPVVRPVPQLFVRPQSLFALPLSDALSTEAVKQELHDALGAPDPIDRRPTKRKGENSEEKPAPTNRNSLFSYNEDEVKIKQELGSPTSSEDVKIKLEPGAETEQDDTASNQPKKVRPNEDESPQLHR